MRDHLNLAHPIHTLCVQGHRYANATTSTHITKCIFPGAQAIEISEGLKVVSPELLLLQMAHKISFAQLIALGFEFCGHYSRSASAQTETQYQLPQLTTQEKLAFFTSLSKGRAGAVPLRRAIPHVRDHSCSPMETNTAMLLGLPCNLGGKGLGMPLMNHQIALDSFGQALTHKGYLKCDLFYPEANLDIEYESTQFHGFVPQEKNREDSVRREALQHMGITVMTLTDRQILRNDLFEAFAFDAAKQLGKRIRPLCRDYPNKLYTLRTELLGRQNQ